MTTFEEIDFSWQLDCVINQSNLESESLLTAKLYTKYLKYNIYFKRKQFELENELKPVVKLYTDYYQGNLTVDELKQNNLEPLDKVTKYKDLDLHLSTTPPISEINNELFHIKMTLSLLEGILECLKQRNWNIRNSIDFLKFKNGQ